jgi:hypothetical protein
LANLLGAMFISWGVWGLSREGVADSALIMATADATGRTKREKLVKANPFLERFTVADLRNWADRKMRARGL